MIFDLFIYSLIQIINNFISRAIPSESSMSFIKEKYFFVCILSLLQQGNLRINSNVILRTALVFLAEYYMLRGFSNTVISLYNITMHFMILPFMTLLFQTGNLLYLICIIIPLCFLSNISIDLILCCICFSVAEILITKSNLSTKDDIFTSSFLLALLVPGFFVFHGKGSAILPSISAAIGNWANLSFIFYLFKTYSFQELLPGRILEPILSFVADKII